MKSNKELAIQLLPFTQIFYGFHSDVGVHGEDVVHCIQLFGILLHSLPYWLHLIVYSTETWKQQICVPETLCPWLSTYWLHLIHSTEIWKQQICVSETLCPLLSTYWLHLIVYTTETWKQQICVSETLCPWLSTYWYTDCTSSTVQKTWKGHICVRETLCSLQILAWVVLFWGFYVSL